jgi:hypothetical protein
MKKNYESKMAKQPSKTPKVRTLQKQNNFPNEGDFEILKMNC